jgi:hypothetical protein
MRGRLLKYILPVFLFSFAFTIPKFFEANVYYSKEILEVNVTVVRENLFCIVEAK